MINYTTTVKGDQTVSEIQQLLSRNGATKIMLDYEDGKVCMLSFQIPHKGSFLSFRLPGKAATVYKIMQGVKCAAKYKTVAQAYNICWRVIKSWLEAQLSLIEIEQADLPTVMLPYAVMQNNSTVSENLLGEKSNEFLLTASS